MTHPRPSQLRLERLVCQIVNCLYQISWRSQIFAFRPTEEVFSKLTFSLSIILLLMGAQMACFTHNFVGKKGRNVTWNLSVQVSIRLVDWKTEYKIRSKIFLWSSGGPPWRSTNMALYMYCVPNWWCTRYVFLNLKSVFNRWLTT